MAELKDLIKINAKVIFKNARKIKRATKAVQKLADSFERLDLNIARASEAIMSFNNALPIVEIEQEKENG